MDVNTDINILGGMPDYNLIRIYIAGEAKDKSTSEVQLQYTNIKTEKAFKRFRKAIDKSMNSFKNDKLKRMIQMLCNEQDLDETMLLPTLVADDTPTEDISQPQVVVNTIKRTLPNADITVAEYKSWLLSEIKTMSAMKDTDKVTF